MGCEFCKAERPAEEKPTVNIHAMSVSSNALPPVLFAQDTGLGKYEMCNLMEGAHKTPKFLALNPFHQIPTMEASNGVTIGESNAMLRYLAANFAVQYYPENAKTRARIDWAMDAMSTTVYTKWAKVVYPVMGFAAAEADPAKAVDELKDAMDCFAHAFIGSGRFICGSVLTIADYKVLPFFYCLTLPAVHHKGGAKLSPRLEKYVEAVMAAVPSSSMMVSFNGWSLKEYIASKEGSLKDFHGTVRVCGEGPECAAPKSGPAQPHETKAKVYGMAASANAMSPILFIKDTGVGDFQQCNLMAGEHKTPAFLAKNPFHQIPTFEGSDGFSIGESGAMLRYIAENYAPSFYPADSKLRALIDWTIDALATTLYKKAAYTVFYPVMGFASAPADQKKANADAHEVIEEFEKAFLVQGGKFICGDTLTIADYKALPLFYALDQPGVASKTGFHLCARLKKYVHDLLLVVKSKDMLESFHGYSIKEYIASKA